jgi:hypothetical protein
MIEVELQRVPDEGSEYEVAATLRVDADGSVHVHDPEHLIPTSLHVLVASPEGELRQVRFEEDPSTWVRNLDSLLRTGYLVPVITRDDTTVESTD